MGYYLGLNGFDEKKMAVAQYYSKSAKMGLQFTAVNTGKNEDGTTNVVLTVPKHMSMWEFATKLAKDDNGNGKLDVKEVTSAISNYSALARMNLKYGQKITLKLDDEHLSQFSAYITNTYEAGDVLHNPPKADSPGTSTFEKGEHYTKLANTSGEEIAESEMTS